MAKKLERPLVIGGNEAYPLTTADQIIKADGSKLETSGGISVDNAEKLGGKAASYYASAEDVNNSIEDVNNSISEINTTINTEISNKIPFSFGIDSNGNYGYIKAGADTVTPFKRDMKNLKIQFNASSIANLTIGNTYFIAMGNFSQTNNTGTVSAGADVLYASEWVNSGSAFNGFYYIGRFYIVKATASTITFANINTGWSHVIYFDMNGLTFDNITYA